MGVVECRIVESVSWSARERVSWGTSWGVIVDTHVTCRGVHKSWRHVVECTIKGVVEHVVDYNRGYIQYIVNRGQSRVVQCIVESIVGSIVRCIVEIIVGCIV